MTGADGNDRNVRPLLGELPGVFRTIPLRRRRSRVPWIYSVYHARTPQADRQTSAHPGMVAESAAPYGWGRR
jgi:hypothetical protein